MADPFRIGVVALSEGSSRYAWKAIPGSSHEMLEQSLLSLPRGCSVLDLGAGVGHLGVAVRGHASHLTGVEEDSRAAVAPGAAAYDRWITARLTPELSPGRIFDVVVCADILEHLESPEEMVRRIRDWLAPDGKLLVSIPNVANLTVRLALLLGQFSYSDRGVLDRTHLRFFTRRSALALIENGGFRAERIRATAMPVELAWPLLGRFPLRALFRGLALAGARLWPTLLGYQFVIEARPR